MKYRTPNAVLLGILYYPLQQAIFYSRFGRFNTAFSPMDLLLPVTGILAFLLLFFVLKRTPKPQARTVLWVVFLLSIPFSLLGSVGGGLLGPIGAVVAGLIPVAVALLLGKGICLLFLRK